MEKTYKILKMVLLVLCFVALLLGATRLYDVLGSKVEMNSLATQETQAAEAEESEKAKQAAPDFTVYDVDGNAYKLSDFRGKPVILNFWATWCGYCQVEMPDFDAKFQEYGEDVHFIMLNVTDGAQETLESASAFIAENGYSFPVYYDTDLDATYSYNTSGLPVTYFLDAEGNFVAWQQGVLSADNLQIGIEMLLS